jgi:hypothetical protein
VGSQRRWLNEQDVNGEAGNDTPIGFEAFEASYLIVD